MAGRARALVFVVVVALLGYVLWTYGVVEKAAARVEARVGAVRGGPAGVANVTPVGPWQPAPDVIGTLYLAHCHGYMAWPFRVRPATEQELTAVAAHPAEPAVPGLLAASRAFHIPRQGTLKADVDAWVQAQRNPDCAATPWPEAALKRLPAPDPEVSKRLKRADAATARELLAQIPAFRVFAAARPVLREGEPLWELRFYATAR